MGQPLNYTATENVWKKSLKIPKGVIRIRRSKKDRKVCRDGAATTILLILKSTKEVFNRMDA
jgi:hypothetical protein